MKPRLWCGLCLFFIPALCAAQGGGAGAKGANNQVTLWVTVVCTGSYHYKDKETGTRLEDHITITLREHDVYRIVKWNEDDTYVELERLHGEREVTPEGGGSYTVPVPEFCEKWKYQKCANPHNGWCGVDIDPTGRNSRAVVSPITGDEFRVAPETANHSVAFGVAGKAWVDYAKDDPANLKPSAMSQQLQFQFDPTKQHVHATGHGSHTYANKTADGAEEAGALYVSFSVEIGPEPPVDAVIKPTGEYKEWVPKASEMQGQPGKTIAFTVELRDKKTGDKPKDRTATFRFKLLGTSNEPGSCMNSPWTDMEPDLKILQSDNPNLANVDDDGQGAKSQEKLTECPITISCFDGGAYCRLQVTADVTDGPSVPAHLEEDGSEEVRIPYDVDGSHIAYQWEQDKGVVGKAPDSDDNDEGLSPGNPNKGDGLTLWEEYRGFLEGGKWDHADPKKLNFFICDTAGGEVAGGIECFQGISKLKVHSHLTPEELGTSRIINRNHTDGPHETDQHGVLIKAVGGGACDTIGGPGTPGMIEAVQVDPNPLDAITDLHTRYWTLWAQVARELLRCCDVWYHGEADFRLVWWWARKVMVDGGDWVTRIYEYSTRPDPASGGLGQQVIVLGENRRPFDPDWFTSPVGVVLGIKGGRYSGSDTCVMRWFDADGYEGPGNVRYWLNDDREKPGKGLCTSPEGTGVNAASHTPQSRYGNATQGDCADQIRVKDS